MVDYYLPTKAFLIGLVVAHGWIQLAYSAYFDDAYFTGVSLSTAAFNIAVPFLAFDVVTIVAKFDHLFLYSNSVIRVSDFLLLKSYIIDNSGYYTAIYYKYFLNVNNIGDLFLSKITYNLNNFRNSNLLSVFRELVVFFEYSNNTIVGIFHNLSNYEDRFSAITNDIRPENFRDYIRSHYLVQPASQDNVAKAFHNIINYETINSVSNKGSLFCKDYFYFHDIDISRPESLMDFAENRLSHICEMITKTKLSPTDFLDEFVSYYSQYVDLKDQCPELKKFLSDWQVFSYNQDITNSEHIDKLIQINTSFNSLSKGDDELKAINFFKRLNLNPSIKSQLIGFLKDIDSATVDLKNNIGSYKYIKVNLHNLSPSRPFTIASICMEDSTHRLVVNSVTSSNGWLVK